jgi:hypothetical protein
MFRVDHDVSTPRRWWKWEMGYITPAGTAMRRCSSEFKNAIWLAFPAVQGAAIRMSE